jgi:hypothetical protein
VIQTPLIGKDSLLHSEMIADRMGTAISVGTEGRELLARASHPVS